MTDERKVITLNIVEGSWEHKLLESVIDHKEELADILFWEQDTFSRACRTIEKQLQG